MVCWCGGSDFLSFLPSHCPHLASDASRDFSSGSSVLLSTLRSMPSAASSLPSASPPGFAAPLLQSSAYTLASSVSSAFSLSGSHLSAAPLPSSGLSSSSVFPPSSSLSSGVPLCFAAVADSVAPSAVPVSTPSLFRPFDLPSAPHSIASTVSAPLGSD